jgi:hypothetical protein
MPDDIHEIYAIKYGHHDRRAAENYIGGDPHDVNDPLDFFVWAIVGPGGTIVVDTGFDAAMAKKRNRALLKPIADGLKSIDIAPETVANVIVSHLHYDHTGNYACFPNARYHLQDTEMAYATGRCMCQRAVAAAVRGGGCGRDGAQGVRRARHVPRRHQPGRAGRARAQDRRALEGPAMRQRARRSAASSCSPPKRPTFMPTSRAGRVFPITYNVGEVLDGYDTIKNWRLRRGTSFRGTIRACWSAIRRRVRPRRGGSHASTSIRKA